MSEKNFASYGDMEALVTEVASKYEKKDNIQQPTVMTISNTNVKTEVGTAKTVTVTTNSGRNVSAESSDTSVATVGTASTTPGTVTVTITPVANGSCTITLSASAKTGYYAAKEYINVTVGSDATQPTIITLNDTLIDMTSSTEHVIADTNSGVTVSVTSSDTNVATAGAIMDPVISGRSIITINRVGNGVCTIEVTASATTGYYAAKAYINVTVGAASGGDTVSKTRYTISYSWWSASANSDGYYTYTQTLDPTLVTTQPPDVSCAGSTDSTVPTNAQKTQYGLVDYYDNTAANTLVLYAKTKPSSTFYIWVEGNNA